MLRYPLGRRGEGHLRYCTADFVTVMTYVTMHGLVGDLGDHPQTCSYFAYEGMERISITLHLV
jgi:hypothetical protein